MSHSCTEKRCKLAHKRPELELTTGTPQVFFLFLFFAIHHNINKVLLGFCSHLRLFTFICGFNVWIKCLQWYQWPILARSCRPLKPLNHWCSPSGLISMQSKTSGAYRTHGNLAGHQIHKLYTKIQLVWFIFTRLFVLRCTCCTTGGGSCFHDSRAGKGSAGFHVSMIPESRQNSKCREIRSAPWRHHS